MHRPALFLVATLALSGAVMALDASPVAPSTVGPSAVAPKEATTPNAGSVAAEKTPGVPANVSTAPDSASQSMQSSSEAAPKYTATAPDKLMPVGKESAVAPPVRSVRSAPDASNISRQARRHAPPARCESTLRKRDARLASRPTRSDEGSRGASIRSARCDTISCGRYVLLGIGY